jgi:hypothetical protein
MNQIQNTIGVVEIEKFYGKKITELLPKKNNSIPLLDPKGEFDKILERGMLYPEVLSKNKILFIGINPSFDDKNKKGKNTQKYENQALEGHHILGYNICKFEEEISRKIPIAGYQSYFKIFEEISSRIEKRNEDYFSWTHYDVLPFREVNQKKITKFLNKSINDQINKIIENFIKLSKEIIEKSDPKIIIVSNAYVRSLFGYYDDDINNKKNISIIPKMFVTKFDDKFGTHKIDDKNSPLDGKFVFFTSMLSGQRALDIGSRDRLIWHINHCLNKTK